MKNEIKRIEKMQITVNGNKVKQTERNAIANALAIALAKNIDGYLTASNVIELEIDNESGFIPVKITVSIPELSNISVEEKSIIYENEQIQKKKLKEEKEKLKEEKKKNDILKRAKAQN